MTEATPQRRKKILVVSAHPESRSLNASLTSFAVEHLRAAGHEVRVSDLYAMKWKAAVDADDFPGRAPDRRLDVLAAQGEATLEERLSPDVAAEQEKVRWSDAVILQFPLWWFSVPAIMKGWIDRVFTFEFAHGPSVPPPYSEGALAGRRALLSVTIGARESSFADRGIHGRLSDVLFPLQHGLFWFTGMAPLEPFALYGSLDVSDERFARTQREYGRRLDRLFTDEPVAYRSLTGGDYGRDMRLLPGAEAPGTSGLDIHVRPRGQRDSRD
ncbi:NAD(P)H-dependent oxidoreductase [Streptomyces sparsogenes]|uniref:Ribosyldihydronicotinamide dehydrogenase n=1 Tax=Streptomyces sparsogenes DSM 40356 TaxID=1331668 RepID=A0A1R1SNW5_9ACTN|nr:NAD(P)H-dependent oxidoreductase [Streptomyces sparsogenes]OMI39689.1 ribosyldihydronicotinamide dehydrogenase [Streptomyces sparsogenes DSM 40356]